MPLLGVAVSAANPLSDSASAGGNPGAVVVESVFSWPGVGRLTVSAVGNRDLAVVQAALLLITVSMVATNLLVDAIYCLFDPRLRASAGAHQ